MGQALGRDLNLPVIAGEIIQTNKVGHARAPALKRLVTPATFDGQMQQGAAYVLVDDHVVKGGTLANLRGYVEARAIRYRDHDINKERPCRWLLFSSNRCKVMHRGDVSMRPALGDDPGKTSRTTITIPESDHAQLIRLAENKHVSLAWVIRDAIRTYLDQQTPLFPASSNPSHLGHQ